MNEQIFAACIIAAATHATEPGYIAAHARDIYNAAIAVMRENAQQANAL